MIKTTVYKEHLGYKTNVINSSHSREVSVKFYYSDQVYVSTQSNRMWFNYRLRTGG